jgi:hypothetical protein
LVSSKSSSSKKTAALLACICFRRDFASQIPAQICARAMNVRAQFRARELNVTRDRASCDLAVLDRPRLSENRTNPCAFSRAKASRSGLRLTPKFSRTRSKLILLPASRRPVRIASRNWSTNYVASVFLGSVLFGDAPAGGCISLSDLSEREGTRGWTHSGTNRAES